MKKRKYGYLLLGLLVLSGLAGTPSDNSLNKKERKLLVSDLKDSKSYFLKSIKGLSNKQLDFRAAPEKWTIRECAEHIVITDGLVFQLIQNSLKQPAEPAKRNELKFTDEQLSQAVRNRTKKVQAPEPIQPTGRFKTIEELVQKFTAQRNDIINYVKITTEDLRNHLFLHPFFGQLDCYQWLLMMSGHSARHTAQIQEVLTAPDFPKN